VNENPSSGDEKSPTVAPGTSLRGEIARTHLLMTCKHCQRGILVPRANRFKGVDCPACGEENPAPKRDLFGPIKKFFRWLAYPSFQDKDC
jgi:hypothetical protein